MIRGPASAIWGANAMTGVVNIITKAPREMQGTSVTMGFGTFNRSVDGQATDPGNGGTFYTNLTHAGGDQRPMVLQGVGRVLRLRSLCPPGRDD